MTGGWVPMQVEWWPLVANSITRPWPREAVLFDLRWWTDQERLGKVKMPGRPALRERWGFSDWDVRMLLRQESAWRDPISSSDSPAALQRPSSSPPTGARSKAGNQPESSSSPPAPLQLPSSETPHARSFMHPYTLHPAQDPQCSGGGHACEALSPIPAAIAAPPPQVPLAGDEAAPKAGGFAAPLQAPGWYLPLCTALQAVGCRMDGFEVWALGRPDLPSEAQRITDWLVDAKSHGKKYKNPRSFINNWLSKVTHDEPRKSQPPSTPERIRGDFPGGRELSDDEAAVNAAAWERLQRKKAAKAAELPL